MKRCYLYLLFLLPISGTLSAQEERTEMNVNFRVGSRTLDPAYSNNAARLADIVAFMEQVASDKHIEITEISFCGTASPEGGYKLNRKLAADRCAALEKYLRSRVNIPDSLVTRTNNHLPWAELTEMVEQADMPYRDEVLNILQNVPEFTHNERGALIDSRKKQLMDLRGGRAWNYLLKHYYSQLRNAAVVFITVRQKPAPEPPAPVAPPPEPSDTLVVAVPTDTIAPTPLPRPFYMGVKTNLLYDALAVPNVGLEFYLGKGWTAGANWAYGWWNNNRRHRYWRMYGADVYVRKWFGSAAARKPLTGHHAGIYAQAFTYDVEWGGKGYMGGQPGGTLWDKANYAFGAEYGYSLPVAKRLNLDFNIGVGYWGGTYYKYRPMDGHYVWQSTNKRHWVGPTKAEISLVWLVGRGNCNEKKGGEK